MSRMDDDGGDDDDVDDGCGVLPPLVNTLISTMMTMTLIAKEFHI